MSEHGERSPRLVSARPLVRYVDEAQAVVEVRVRLDPLEAGRDAKLGIELQGPEGEVIERASGLQPLEHAWMARFEIGEPRRWWPAGMGEQSLYELTIELVADGTTLDRRTTILGLTSVRRPRGETGPALLVNGRERPIERLIPVEPNDETRLLAASGDALLVVRDHYGPDVLFDAADRAGVMLLQAIPERGRKAGPALAQVDRLAAHPSLAGWLIEEPEEPFADRLHRLDPTRVVFREPELEGA